MAATVSAPLRGLCAGRVGREEFVAFLPTKPVDPSRFIRLKIQSLRAAPAWDRHELAHKQIGFHFRPGNRVAARARALSAHLARLAGRP
jgi:hypothetical protein